MSGKPYSYEEVNYRLMCYKGAIYKFKIEFSDCGPGKTPIRRVLTPSESHQIDRTVGVLVHQKYRRTGLTKALQTKDFLIKCSERLWKIGKKVGFRLRGEELATHDFMILVNVAPKQRGLPAINSVISLRDRPNIRSADSQRETQHGRTAQSGATEIRQSSSAVRVHDLGQQTSADRGQKAAQGPEPLPRQLQSSSKQPWEPSSGQTERISRPSPWRSRKIPEPSQNVKSPRQLEKIHERSPRQLRRSPRLLQSEESPVQLQTSPTVSPRKSSSAAHLAAQDKSPRGVKRHSDVSPRIFRKRSRPCQTSSNQSSPVESPEKHPIPGVSPRVMRGSPRLSPVRSSKRSPAKSSEMLVSPEISPVRRSGRPCSVRLSQGSPLKSPKRREILGKMLQNLSKAGHSVGSEDDKIAKCLRSNSAKLLTSDVTATERLLHPLDKEFVRREYEQEERRLLNLAKPSTTSAERKAWLFSL